MLLKVNNRVLVRDREKTYLTKASAASSTADQELTVRAMNTLAWGENDFVIVGEIGSKTSEVVRISAGVQDGTSLTISRNATGADANGLRYDHAVDEPVYRIDFNQIEIRHSSTDATAPSTVTATRDLQVDDPFTRFEDAVHGDGFGFVRFKNERTGAFSAFSDGIPYTGQSPQSLAKMIKKVRNLINEPKDEYISDDEITEALNDKQRDIAHLFMWSFYEVEFSYSSVANQFAYDLLPTVKDGTVYNITYGTQPLESIGRNRWSLLHWDTDQSTDNPSAAHVWAGQIKIYPRPSSSADTTMLDGAISASDTTLTVDATSGFERGDYYRFIIDDEVIYATDATTTTFTGCLRAQEGTLAAAHIDDSTVTERNIVLASQTEPVDLFDQNQLTVIPDPLVLCLGAAADVALGKLQNEPLHDRLNNRYEAGVDSLKNKYSLKFTGQFKAVTPFESTISNLQGFRNPNLFPRDVG